MIKTSRLGMALLGLGLFPLAAPANPGHWLPPIRVNFTFRFDVHSLAEPHPSAPWWCYFPQDPHQGSHAAHPAFPHWPAAFPPQAQPTAAPRTPAAGPNMVYDYLPSPVLPVGYHHAPPPSYWYGR